MEDLWCADSRVLNSVVQDIEVEGGDRPDLPSIFASLGLDEEQGTRSVRRLVDAGMPRGKGMLGGAWFVTGVTERGLRESRAWPDRADQLAAQLIAALAEAAERETEPEKRSRLRTAATGVAGVGRDMLTEVIASYAAKMSGAA